MWTFEKIHRLFSDSAESRGPSPQKSHTCLGTPTGALENKGFCGHLPFQACSLELPGRGALAEELGLGCKQDFAAQAPDFQRISLRGREKGAVRKWPTKAAPTCFSASSGSGLPRFSQCGGTACAQHTGIE